MAKKAKGDRTDPKQNKSLAIREALKASPKAKAAEIAAAVKKDYGHSVTATLVYLVKSKSNVKKAGRKAKAAGKASPAMGGDWIASIKAARVLLQAAGSVENATAILKAVEG